MRGDEQGKGTGVLGSALISLAFLVLATGTYLFFVRTSLGQRLDASSFGAVTWLRAPLGSMAGPVRVGLLVIAAILFAVLAIRALLARRLRIVIVAVVICLITLVLASLLKDVVLTRPYLGDFGYRYNTFPSGHEAVTTAALVGSFLMIPAMQRRAVVLLPLLILGSASGLAQVVAYAHRPSDVFAGALLAGAVAAWFPGRSGSIGVRWLSGLWIYALLAAAAGALALASWQASGYATALQVAASVGIGLCASACVCAALIVGTRRRMSSR